MKIDFAQLGDRFDKIGLDAYNGLKSDLPDLRLSPQQAEIMQRQLATLARVGSALLLASGADKTALEQEGREAYQNVLNIACCEEKQGEMILLSRINAAIAQAIAIVLAGITAA